MKDIVLELNSIAELFDQKGKVKIAKIVDSITSDVLDIRTAQYVGAQGYWVRNTRCWSNCYRSKRASSPSTPTQEVWSECHAEYVKSINNPGTKWDKYADSSEGIVKSASARNHFDTKLASSIKKKTENGADMSFAIAESLDERTHESFDKLIMASNKLLDIARNTDDLSLSIRLGKTASDLTLEAQRSNINPGKWWDKGVQGLGNAKDKVQQGLANKRKRSNNRLDIDNKLKDYKTQLQGNPNAPQPGMGATAPQSGGGSVNQSYQPSDDGSLGLPNFSNQDTDGNNILDSWPTSGDLDQNGVVTPQEQGFMQELQRIVGLKQNMDKSKSLYNDSLQGLSDRSGKTLDNIKDLMRMVSGTSSGWDTPSEAPTPATTSPKKYPTKKSTPVGANPGQQKGLPFKTDNAIPAK